MKVKQLRRVKFVVKDLDNDLMLGMLTDYGDESKIIKDQEVNNDKEVGQAQFCRKIVLPLLS